MNSFNWDDTPPASHVAEFTFVTLCLQGQAIQWTRGELDWWMASQCYPRSRNPPKNVKPAQDLSTQLLDLTLNFDSIFKDIVLNFSILTFKYKSDILNIDIIINSIYWYISS